MGLDLVTTSNDQRNRILGYDLARALAVFGMVLVNFKVVMCGQIEEPTWLSWSVGLLEGRAAATFVVLAGVGISLMTGRGRLSNNQIIIARDRGTLIKRAVFLFVVGLLYTPIWPADILHFYGIYILIAAFLFTAPNGRILIVAFSLAAVSVAMVLFLDYEREWDWETLTYSGLWTVEGFTRHLFFNGFHPVIPWLAFLLLGMVVGRLNMREPALRGRVFTWGVASALFAESLSWVLIRFLSSGGTEVESEDIAALFGTSPIPPVPLYMIAGSGTACAVIAASVEVGERCRDSVLLFPLTATGQLALTLYVSHVVVGMGTLDALGRLYDQTVSFSVLATVAFCVSAGLFASVWRKYFKRGPLEAVMRTLTEPQD